MSVHPPRWEPRRYLALADERGRPFVDLLARVELADPGPRDVVDLGCGPGNLTALLAARWPQAELVLIGLPWAREWAQRLPMVHRFIEFPGWPGLPEREPDLAALPGWLQAMQAERFDLLLQLQGSGSVVNHLLAVCAPQRLAGFAEPDDLAPEPAL